MSLAEVRPRRGDPGAVKEAFSFPFHFVSSQSDLFSSPQLPRISLYFHSFTNVFSFVDKIEALQTQFLSLKLFLSFSGLNFHMCLQHIHLQY